MKILIVGRTASGKDRLRTLLEQDGISFVVSATDRPKRDGETTEHEFISISDMDKLWPDAVAKTTIGDYRYAASLDTVSEADAYIVDPKGVNDLCKALPNERFLLVYVHADDEKRAQVAAARNNDENATSARESAEKAAFDDFEANVIVPNTPPTGIGAVLVVDNDYTPKTLEMAADNIVHQWHLMLQMRHIMEQCRRELILRGPANDLEHITVTYDDERIEDVSLDDAAFQALAVDDNLPSIIKAWLMLPNPTMLDFSQSA